MKALVVYESIFGNTRRIAEAIGAGLRAYGEVRVLEVSMAPARADGLDLLVVGGPTHAWGMSRASTRAGAREQAEAKRMEPPSPSVGVREWLSALFGGRGIPAVAFDTAIKTTWSPTGSAARQIARRLGAAGFRVDVPATQFLVSDTDGPLLEGEIERARVWAEGLAVDLGLAAEEPARAR